MARKRRRDEFPTDTMATPKEEQIAPDPYPLFTRIGVPDGISSLDRDIADLADWLSDAITRASKAGRHGLKPEDAKFLAYTLIVYRTRNGVPLTEHHLRLLAAALGVKRAPKAVTEILGLPHVHDPEKFIAAADLCAEQPNISLNKLARSVRVDRSTMRAWKKMKPFADRERATRIRIGALTEEDRKNQAMWERVVEKVNREMAKPRR